MNSRFQRSNTLVKKDSDAPDHGPEKGNGREGVDVNHQHDYQDLQDLRARLTKVQERKMKTEIKLEQTTKQLEECKKAAFELFGVTTLEELEDYVKKTEEEDREIMRDFCKKLEEEETKLNTIDEQLKALEQDPS